MLLFIVQLDYKKLCNDDNASDGGATGDYDGKKNGKTVKWWW